MFQVVVELLINLPAFLTVICSLLYDMKGNVSKVLYWVRENSRKLYKIESVKSRLSPNYAGSTSSRLDAQSKNVKSPRHKISHSFLLSCQHLKLIISLFVLFNLEQIFTDRHLDKLENVPDWIIIFNLHHIPNVRSGRHCRSRPQTDGNAFD